MKTLIMILLSLVLFAGCAVVPADHYYAYGPYYDYPYYAPPVYGYYGYYYPYGYYHYGHRGEWHEGHHDGFHRG